MTKAYSSNFFALEDEVVLEVVENDTTVRLWSKLEICIARIIL